MGNKGGHGKLNSVKAKPMQNDAYHNKMTRENPITGIGMQMDDFQTSFAKKNGRSTKS